jgi:Fe2+ transport system protein FeoA
MMLKRKRPDLIFLPQCDTQGLKQIVLSKTPFAIHDGFTLAKDGVLIDFIVSDEPMKSKNIKAVSQRLVLDCITTLTSRHFEHTCNSGVLDEPPATCSTVGASAAGPPSPPMTAEQRARNKAQMSAEIAKATNEYLTYASETYHGIASNLLKLGITEDTSLNVLNVCARTDPLSVDASKKFHSDITAALGTLETLPILLEATMRSSRPELTGDVTLPSLVAEARAISDSIKAIRESIASNAPTLPAAALNTTRISSVPLFKSDNVIQAPSAAEIQNTIQSVAKAAVSASMHKGAKRKRT